MSFQNKLDEFTRNLDLAKWYMGISAKQEATMSTMSESLRDDFEQGTGEKMFKALISLGLQPVISKKKISRIVQLSRNNILAFLFFVMEGYYKTKQKDGVYSINEQLIMNAIAKIDMMPTIRALDLVLPQAPVKKQDPQTQSLASLTTERPKKKPSKKSPYFLRQPKPVQRTSRLTAKIPEFVVSFNFWPINGPPEYGTDDEEPWYALYRLNPGQRLIKKTLSETLERYFKLAVVEGKHDEEVTEQSREPEANMCLVHKGQVLQAQLLRDELAVKARDRCLELLDVNEPYAKLRKARIVAQLEHDIDLIMARHRNAMHCDQTKVLTIENFNCVLCQQMLVSQPWPETKGQIDRALVGEDITVAHTAAYDTYRGKRLEGGAEKPKNKDCTVARTSGIDTCRGKRLEGGAEKPDCTVNTPPAEKGRGKRLKGGGGKPKKDKKGKKEKKAKVVEPEPEPPKKVKVSPWKPPPRKLVSGPFRIHNIDFNEYTHVCKQVVGPTECDVPPAPKKSAVSFILAKGKIEGKAHKCDMRMPNNRHVKTRFFRGPRSNKPYQFKYHRVFQSGQPKPFDLSHIMAKSFVKALDQSDEDEADPCYIKELMSEMVIEDEAPPDSKSEGHPEPEPERKTLELFSELDQNKISDSRETLDRSSNHSGRSHVNYKAEIVDAVVRCAKAVWQKRSLIKRAEMERMGRMTPRKALTHKDTESFDPNDAAQMDKLLKDGMRVLRKEPRYVLACLPDAHKLPVLREWVKRRYGKTYSQKELEDSIAESNRIFELVTILQSSPASPDLMGIDRLPRSKENFNFYKQIKNTAALAKQTYHDQLNARYLNIVSSAWYAMGNYLVPGGPPRKTFFAYIASNPLEIMRNKTWNGDFRNYRSMRDKRKEQERLLGKKD
ncbi:GD11748 [Drosophila simulans]|uniref:GD11748 n=1 Tax=Drosophila simulans TaxID=7240 RepID=B4QIL4_DROSI|nr:GD11748 [Drosophila simulans]